MLDVVLTLLIVAVLVFLFAHLLSGGPVRLVTGPEADETTVSLVRKNLGLNKPMHEQLVRFFASAARDEFGSSIRTKRPVSEEVGERFRPALNLAITSMAWAVVFGTAVSTISAVWHDKRPNRLGMTLAVSGIFSPAFVLDMLLMEVFSVQLSWLPSIGADSWKHYILPSFMLSVVVAAVMAHLMRAPFVEVLQEDFVRTVRAKGVRETMVVIKHCLRNTMIPVVTIMDPQFGFLLGGSIVVEKVFNWLGLRRLLVDAVEMYDYPVIRAEVLLLSLEFILVNLMVDMLYTVINPIVRHKK